MKVGRAKKKGILVQKYLTVYKRFRLLQKRGQAIESE